MQPRHGHIPELQLLRGLAALVVLLSHGSYVFATGPAFRHWTEAILNAHAAVMLFFVLSGYVLSRALTELELDFNNLLKFYLARLFRIYPMVWVASAVALLCAVFFLQNFEVNGASAWYLKALPAFGAKGIASSFCCGGNALVPPMWSIRVELEASLVIPLLVLATRERFGWWSLIASGALGLTPIRFFIFLPCFVLGVLAFRYQARFGPYVAKLPWLLSSISMLWLFRLMNPAWRFEVNYHAYVPLVVESVAAAALIIGLVERRAALLRSKVGIQLGDISYSVYLLHFIVMSVIAIPIGLLPVGANVRAIILMASTLVITLPLASLSYEWIELRGISIGKGFYAAMRLRTSSALALRQLSSSAS